MLRGVMVSSRRCAMIHITISSSLRFNLFHHYIPWHPSPHLFSAHRFLKVFSRHRPLADESVLQEHSKRGFFARHARPNSPLQPTTSTPNPVPNGKVRTGEGEQGDNVDNRGSANDPLSAGKGKGKQRD